MKEKDIHYFSTTGYTRANVVERFIRTLKGRMYHYFTGSNSSKHFKILPALVKGYNWVLSSKYWYETPQIN